MKKLIHTRGLNFVFLVPSVPDPRPLDFFYPIPPKLELPNLQEGHLHLNLKFIYIQKDLW